MLTNKDKAQKHEPADQPIMVGRKGRTAGCAKQAFRTVVLCRTINSERLLSSTEWI